MSKEHTMPDDALLAMREFIEAFETVFDADWEYTKSMLGIREESAEQKAFAEKMGLEGIDFIAPSGTFLHPQVDDEVEDWGNRGLLLQRYRRIKHLISD